MRKYLALTLCLLKESGGAMAFRLRGKRGKLGLIAFWALMVLGFLPLIVMFGVLFFGMYEFFAPIGQLAYITAVAFNVVSIVIFMFAVIQTPSVFYLSRDIEHLLPLPLTAAQIIAAKFTVSLIYEYITTLVFLGPMYVVYMLRMNPALLLLNGLPVLLTLPVIPLVYATVIVMLLMRFTGFAKNKDLINYVVGICAVALGVGFSAVSQRFNNINQEQILEALQGSSALLDALTFIFPSVRFSAAAVADGSVPDMLLNLAVVAAAVFIFLALAKPLYFKGVIGLTEASASSKKMTRGELDRAATKRNVLFSYLAKELRQVFRSPAVFLNCAATVILVPLMLFVSLAAQSETLEYIKELDFTEGSTVGVTLTIAAVSSVFVSSMCSVSATSVSREGSNYIFMKYIPVKYGTQLNAKALSGVVICLAGVLTFFVAAAFVLGAPPLVLLGALVVAVPGVILVNYAGVLVDLLHPKLEWDDEQSAVKRNINVLFMMAFSLVPAIAVGVAGIFVYSLPLLAFAVIFCLQAALAAAVYFAVATLGVRLLNKI